MTDHNAPAPLGVSYTICVPDATDDTVVGVEAKFNRSWSRGRLELALASTVAPELGSTFEYYGIDEHSVTVTIDGKSVDPEFPKMGPRGYQLIQFDVPQGAEDKSVAVCYQLDTRRGDLSVRAIGQTYKDRVVVNQEYATLRGDTMLFPVTGPIERGIA